MDAKAKAKADSAESEEMKSTAPVKVISDEPTTSTATVKKEKKAPMMFNENVPIRLILPPAFKIEIENPEKLAVNQFTRNQVIPNDITLIRTFDGKPLNTSGFEIIKQLSSGHAFCELKRKRLRGFCVKCIKKCKNVNFKKLLPKIETYCPSCPNGEWICANCFDIEHGISA